MAWFVQALAPGSLLLILGGVAVRRWREDAAWKPLAALLLGLVVLGMAALHTFGSRH